MNHISPHTAQGPAPWPETCPDWCELHDEHKPDDGFEDQAHFRSFPYDDRDDREPGEILLYLMEQVSTGIQRPSRRPRGLWVTLHQHWTEAAPRIELTYRTDGAVPKIEPVKLRIEDAEVLANQLLAMVHAARTGQPAQN